ncbi:Hypothetical predicted protein, partial [Podarcis lilfordi]
TLTHHQQNAIQVHTGENADNYRQGGQTTKFIIHLWSMSNQDRDVAQAETPRMLHK